MAATRLAPPPARKPVAPPPAPPAPARRAPPPPAAPAPARRAPPPAPPAIVAAPATPPARVAAPPAAPAGPSSADLLAALHAASKRIDAMTGEIAKLQSAATKAKTVSFVASDEEIAAMDPTDERIAWHGASLPVRVVSITRDGSLAPDPRGRVCSSALIAIPADPEQRGLGMLMIAWDGAGEREGLYASPEELQTLRAD